MSDFKALLLAVEAKLLKDPKNEELLETREQLLEAIELSCDLEEEEEKKESQTVKQVGRSSKNDDLRVHASSSKADDKFGSIPGDHLVEGAIIGSGSSHSGKRQSSTEAEILAKKKEKNRKKKEKLRERMKEQLEIAESEKQSWQSFASKKGLKGMTKKSIFTSPCSVTDNLIKMMGPYYYYDSSYVEDVSTDYHIHDCMWSGECYTCQPRVTFTNQVTQMPAAPMTTNGALPIGLNAPPGYITLTPTRVAGQLHHHHRSPEKPTASWPSPGEPTRSIIQMAQSSHQSPEVSIQSLSDVDNEDVEDVDDDNTDEDVNNDNDDDELENCDKGGDITSASKASARKKRGGLDKSVSSKRSSARRNSIRPASKECSSQDNKKLRHREVEKNRHRQLQAMVKTLSEKIPGRLDKETQVQTMKRAARYCLFLREVKNMLSHGLPQPSILMDKLEKIYSRSCDNVELIMTQSSASSR